MATTAPTQGTAQKLEENPALPTDNQKDLTYVLSRLFRLIAKVVNPMLAKLANVTIDSGSGQIAIAPPPGGNATGLILDYTTGGYAQIYSRRNQKIRWVNLMGYEATAYPETGANAGSPWVLNRCDDNGNGLGAVLMFDRAFGNATFYGAVTTPSPLTVNNVGQNNNAVLNLIKNNVINASDIVGAYTNLTRWLLRLGAGDNGAAGDNFMIGRANNAGTLMDYPLVIDRNTGAVLQGNKPMFFASGVNAATSGTNILFQSPQVNVGGYYNVGTGRFTAPNSGIYFFRASAMYNGPPGEIRLQITKNGAVYSGSGTINTIPNGVFGMGWTDVHISLSTGDYVNVLLATLPAGGTLFSGDGTWHSFSGHLVG